MNVSEQITEQIKNTVARIVKDSGDPIRAILSATMEAGYKSGLVDQLYINVVDCLGNVIHATMQDRDVTFVNDDPLPDLRFPIQIVVTDEVCSGKLEVAIQAEEMDGLLNLTFSATWEGAAGAA